MIRFGLAAVLAFAIAGCTGGSGAGSGTGSGSGAAAAAKEFGPKKLPFKIGIMTGTVAQGEDEYRGAEAVIREYGADAIRHVSYPDNFMTESETTISRLKGVADDPDVKAIIVAQAVPGTIPAIKKIKRDRPDLIFILNTPHEDPTQVPKYADLALNTDDLRRGETIVAVAQRLGAKAFVHYSFPRHMSQQLLSQRRDLMRQECEKRGMRFESVNAPDPTGDQGLPGAQKFVLEDVPRQVALLGKDTAFFSTNCGMQEPLIKAALDAGAIVPEQCCPSPTHGYPGALGIGIDEASAGDMEKIRGLLAKTIAERGGKGRFATWPASINVAMIQASVELARKAVAGGAKSIVDPEAVQEAIATAGGMKADVRALDGAPNYMLVIAESVVF